MDGTKGILANRSGNSCLWVKFVLYQLMNPTIWVKTNLTCLLNGSKFLNLNTTYLLNELVMLTCLSDFIKMKKKNICIYIYMKKQTNKYF